jgi:hypothetical protein
VRDVEGTEAIEGERQSRREAIERGRFGDP